MAATTSATGMDKPSRAGPADNQIADLVDARIAQLKASLRLTVEQDGSWGGVETALHDYGVGLVRSRYDYQARIDETRDGMRRWRDDRRGEEGRSADKRSDETATAGPVSAPSSEIAMMRWEADDLAQRAILLRKVADAVDPLFTSLGDRQRRMLIRFMEDGFDRVGR
jgi:hypothetical protein